VVIAGLSDQAGGRAAGRVAVLVDGDTDAFDALALAFRAADRRGIGVTVLHASSTRTARARLHTAELIAACRDAFSDVDVAEMHLATPLRPALAAASKGAALLVLGARPPRHIHWAQLTAVTRTAAKGAHTHRSSSFRQSARSKGCLVTACRCRASWLIPQSGPGIGP